VLALQPVLSTEEQAIEFEKAGRWADAHAFYEQNLQVFSSISRMVFEWPRPRPILTLLAATRAEKSDLHQVSPGIANVPQEPRLPRDDTLVSYAESFRYGRSAANKVGTVGVRWGWWT